MFHTAIPFPNLNPEIFSLPPIHLGDFTLGPFALRWYALAYIAGLLLGWRYMVRNIKNERLWGGRAAPMKVLDADDFLFWATIGVILGGRIGYILFYRADLLVANQLQILEIWQGGMSFHGGMIGVLLAMLWFAHRRGIPLLSLADLAAAATPIGLFFGRLANFVNGELWGRPTTLPWGVIFPNADGLPRHPSQLYEAALEGLALFVILRLATHKFHTFIRPGLTVGLFLLFYAVFRMSLENVRQPDAQMPDFPYGLTMGMMLSVPMLLAGLAFITAALVRGPAKAAPKRKKAAG